MTEPGPEARPGRGEGRVVLVTSVGGASGSKAAAAALACAGSDADRAGLLIDLGERGPRPALVATAAARTLEERLVAHLPEAALASRGRFCQMTLPADRESFAGVAAALPVVRGSVAVVHLPPYLLQPALGDRGIAANAALLRADLGRDRALTALAVHDLVRRGLRVVVLKRALGRLAACAALLGAPPVGAQSQLRSIVRLLQRPALEERSPCYGRQQDAEGEAEEDGRQGQAPEGARRRQARWIRPDGWDRRWGGVLDRDR